MPSAYNPEKPDQQPKSRYEHLSCEAENCPLPGSMSVEHAPWCCRFHAKAPRVHWHTITMVLNQHLRLHRIVRAAESLSAAEFDQIQSSSSWALSDFIKPKPGESYPKWVHRIKHTVGDTLAEKLNAAIAKQNTKTAQGKSKQSISWAVNELTSGTLLKG